MARHLSTAELEAGLDEIRQSPADHGRVELIVRRPAVDKREALEEAHLDVAIGLRGDTWSERASRSSPDGGPHPDCQLTVMNARAIALIAQEYDRWQLAGDQLYLDFDLSARNVPARTRLALGDAVIEITDKPHTGCAKFSQRFGIDAVRFVNSPAGKELHLRGVNAKVVRSGTLRRGDEVRKTAAGSRAPTRCHKRGPE